NLQPLSVAALQGKVVAHDAEHVHEIGLALEDAAVEVELEVELALFGGVGQLAGDGGRFGTFARMLPRLRHFSSPPLRGRFGLDLAQRRSRRTVRIPTWIITRAETAAKQERLSLRPRTSRRHFPGRKVLTGGILWRIQLPQLYARIWEGEAPAEPVTF